MLAIEVEYLLGRAYAADYRDSTEPEWPPHPSRLFSALVAAYHDRSGTDAERAALTWMEQLGPPCVAAGSAGERNTVVTYVPTNYAGKSGSTHPDQRGKQPRSFPAQGPERPVVHFIWPDAAPSEEVLERLRGLIQRVPCLGRACSLVRVALVESAREPNYVPDNSGSEILQGYGQGRLEELETLYRLDQRPRNAPQWRYRKNDGLPKNRPVTGCFGEMIILRRVSGIGLPIESSLTLTKAVRAALMSLAGEHDLMSDMLSGHGAHPHCAIAPLPFAGYRHASGRLMGVAVVLPRAILPGDRRKVLTCCTLLEIVNLREPLGAWNLEISNFDVPQKTLQPAVWMGASKQWSTVTPILLDRFPKKKLSVDDILRTACERVELPQPVDIKHGPFSWLEGVPPVTEFRLLRDGKDRSRWAVHATFEFDRPVKGPILLGAGRYFGLGMMKPAILPYRAAS